MADLQGFEPRQSEPESLVLPLHHRSALCHKIYHKFAKLQVDFLKFSKISLLETHCTRRNGSEAGAKMAVWFGEVSGQLLLPAIFMYSGKFS